MYSHTIYLRKTEVNIKFFGLNFSSLCTIEKIMILCYSGVYTAAGGSNYFVYKRKYLSNEEKPRTSAVSVKSPEKSGVETESDKN